MERAGGWCSCRLRYTGGSAGSRGVGLAPGPGALAWVVSPQERWVAAHPKILAVPHARKGSQLPGLPWEGVFERGRRCPGALIASALYLSLAGMWHLALLGERVFLCNSSKSPRQTLCHTATLPLLSRTVSLLFSPRAQISCEVSPCCCRFNVQNLLFVPLLCFPRAVPGSCNRSLVTGTNWDCKLVLFTAHFWSAI